MPSRVGRGRRVTVDLMVCFGWDGFFRVYFFFDFLLFERTRPAASLKPHLPHYPLY